LTLSQADSIAADDLASPQAYRRAMHREFVKRRPGSYTRDWLAQRLGVSKWTSRRYDLALKMVVHPTYIEHPLRWTNVESLVPRTIEDAPPGTFLETEDGKRYPPLRSIAMHLLDIGHKVVHKTRAANYYRLPETPGVGIPTHSMLTQTHVALSLQWESEQSDSCSHLPDLPLNQPREIPTTGKDRFSPAAPGVGIPTPSQSDTQYAFWLCPSCLKTHIATDPPDTCARCGTSDWERVPDVIWRDQESLKVYWQERWREKHPSAPRHATPLVNSSRCRNSDTRRNVGLYQSSRTDAETERAAQQAHERVPGLSRINALRLVSRYGIPKLEDAITKVERRNSVRNPAGFLIALLRSEHSFYLRKTNETRQCQSQDAAEWIQRMTESTFVEFLSNADEFVDHTKSK
jgi:hypothetical protein